MSGGKDDITKELVYKDGKYSLTLTDKNGVLSMTEQVRELRAMWHGSEEYWNGGAWERMNEYEDRCLRLEQAWEEWHRACMEWLEKAQEMEVL